MPHKTWTVGEELAADFNLYVQNQTVPQFPNVAARDTWAGPPAGATCITTDTRLRWIYTGAAWVLAGPSIQTCRFSCTHASGYQTRDVIYPVAFPAGWTVIPVGTVATPVTSTSPVWLGTTVVDNTKATVRAATITNLAYNGASGPHWLTVAAFPPGAEQGGTWHYGATPVLLTGEARPAPDTQPTEEPNE